MPSPPTENWRNGTMIDCNPSQARQYIMEIRKCRKCPEYFVDTYCMIDDPTSRAWTPFRLWPAQRETLQEIACHRLTVILKARQLGLTWLVLAYTLWMMLLQPA